ncbi:MAG TPA: ferritin-like domain-containing protein [Polyangiaceae bacterium]|nr:ferritin-like domain-containing protein [Polyangiaceae bacterium]
MTAKTGAPPGVAVRAARWIGWCFGVSGLIALPSRARAADGHVLSLGYMHSFVYGDVPAAGNGMEGTLVFYPDSRTKFGLGGFAQLESYSPSHLRLATGFQANYSVLGFELGYAYRAESPGGKASHGLQFGPFFSTGIVSTGLRVVPTIAPGAGGYGTEVTWTLAFKIPVWISGDPLGSYFTFGLPHGRPLRIGDELCFPDLQSSVHTESVAGGLPDIDAYLARQWSKDAQEEHASIAEFSRLSLSLMVLGAPLPLLEAAQRAALDEIEHARGAFALMARYSKSRVVPGPMPRAAEARPTSSRVELASECLRDGCLGEGVAAAVARYASERAEEPALRAFLAVISEDEARHAELSWAILEWCLETGGREVAWALSWAAGQLPLIIEPEQTEEALAAEPLESYGRASWEAQLNLFWQVRGAVLTRLSAMLAVYSDDDYSTNRALSSGVGTQHWSS